MANLTQLRMLEEVDGFLLIDKPAGIALSTVVKTIKRKFNLVKVGHGGSLDVMASGLLVLLLNDANKFANRIMEADRVYEGVLKAGGTTNTGDIHGEKVEKKETTAIEEMRGDVFLTEPRFAAIRKEGSAGYEVVDTGEHTQALGHIYKFVIAEEGRFILSATKGVLPRAIAYDLGMTLTELRRVKIGRLAVEEAIGFDKLLELELKDFKSWVKPISAVLQ